MPHRWCHCRTAVAVLATASMVLLAGCEAIPEASQAGPSGDAQPGPGAGGAEGAPPPSSATTEAPATEQPGTTETPVAAAPAPATEPSVAAPAPAPVPEEAPLSAPVGRPAVGAPSAEHVPPPSPAQPPQSAAPSPAAPETGTAALSLQGSAFAPAPEGSAGAAVSTAPPAQPEIRQGPFRVTCFHDNEIVFEHDHIYRVWQPHAQPPQWAYETADGVRFRGRMGTGLNCIWERL